jgi:hypothetical protein
MPPMTALTQAKREQIAEIICNGIEISFYQWGRLDPESYAIIMKTADSVLTALQSDGWLADEIAWLESRAENYGGHPADTLRERANELRALVADKCEVGK